MTDGPLASFCLKSFNQKAYIGEALDGAFAQTYRPLEIVICDDHSTDGSWDLIEERVRAWKSARVGTEDRVSLIVHRNEVNLGNTKNWEMCGKLAHGEILIKADGDDISLPERTAKVVEAWVRDGKRAKVVTHAVTTIPGDLVIADRHARWPLGAGMAWTRDCFEGWPEIGDDCRRSFDDIIYSMRGVLLGPDLILTDRLVRYRLGSGETSALHSYRRPYARGQEANLAGSPQKRRDLEVALQKGWIDRARYETELKGLVESDSVCGALLDLMSESSGFLRKWRAFQRVKYQFNWRGRIAFGIFLFPSVLSEPLMALAMRLRSWIKRGCGPAL